MLKYTSQRQPLEGLLEDDGPVPLPLLLKDFYDRTLLQEKYLYHKWQKNDLPATAMHIRFGSVLVELLSF